MITVEPWFEEFLRFLWDNRKVIQKNIKLEYNADIILDMIPKVFERKITELQRIWLRDRINDKCLLSNSRTFEAFAQDIIDRDFPVPAKIVKK